MAEKIRDEGDGDGESGGLGGEGFEEGVPENGGDCAVGFGEGEFFGG